MEKEESYGAIPVRRSRIRRWARRVMITLAILFVLAAAVLYWIQDKLIFPGSSFQGTEAAQVRPRVGERLLTLATEGGETVAAIYLPALSRHGEARADAADRPVIIYFYGNGECMSFNVDGSRAYRQMGYNVLIPDYPGYGLSPGRPSGAGVYRTADACYAYLTQTLRVPPGRIAVFGRSLGGAAAVYLAAKHPVGALVTLSAFRSLGEIAANTVWHLLPTSLFIRHRLDNLSRMKDVRCPALIVHGTEDGLIPFDSAAELAKAAGGPARVYPVAGAGHNNLYDVGGAELEGAVGEFLEATFDGAQKKSPG